MYTLLNDLFEEVLVETGEFILGKSNIELDISKFRLLVKRVLKTHNHHAPKVITIPITMQGNSFTFEETFSYKGEVLGIPKYVVSVTPSGLAGSGSTLSGEIGARINYSKKCGGWSHLTGGNCAGSGSSCSNEKTPYPFRWECPTLYVIAGTSSLVKLAYEYKVITDEDATACNKYKIDTKIANDRTFMKLLCGHFLYSIGRSRTAFTLSEIPIQDDANEIKSEGKSLIDEAEEEYKESRHKFYLAYR